MSNPQKHTNSHFSQDEMSERSKDRFKIQGYIPRLPKATFYVQSKGLHAGRPLASPIPNCWAIYSTIPNLKQIAFSLYKSRQLEPLIIGTIIPYIRLSEYKHLLFQATQNHQEYNQDNLRTIELLEAQIEVATKQIELLKQYQTALAFKINHHLFSQPS